MLEILAVSTKEVTAQKFGITTIGLNSWLYRIRERRRESRYYLNKILSLEKRNAHLRKSLLPSKADEELITDVRELE